MNRLSLTNIAISLLQINEDISSHFKNPYNTKISDFIMYDFDQMWGNTSGGFEGIGGSAMTKQRTYVFIPQIANEDCIVYFGGRYAYSCPRTAIFLEDVEKREVKGCKSNSCYFSSN